MHINDIENIMNYLFSAALKKCGNFEDAEDLTSETLLAALKYPNEIQDIKKWLSGVLNHKYYDMLRHKYKLPTVSINLITEDIPDFEEEQADVPSADVVKWRIFRESIVRLLSAIILTAKRCRTLPKSLVSQKVQCCQGCPQAESRYGKDLILWNDMKSKAISLNGLGLPVTAVWGLMVSHGH